MAKRKTRPCDPRTAPAAGLAIAAGDLVRVTAEPRRGAALCRVEAIWATREAPELPNISADALMAIRELHAEWGVSRMAMLSYPYRGQRFCFAALEHKGEWWDLQRKQLKISRTSTLPRS